MTMLPRVCRSTVPATMSISARGPVLATITFVLGGLCMELTLYKLASFAAAANWLSIVLGGISMELALNVFTLFPTVRSLWVDTDPGAIRFGKTSRGPFGRTITPHLLTSMLMRLMVMVSMHTVDGIYRW